jgi:succinyl-diaminopimelate desuccinylase
MEERIADHVETICLATADEHFVTRIGNSIVCDPMADLSGVPVVALVGHLDTVRCAEDQPLEIREGRVYGCGASDMKGGVATMIELLNARKSVTSARVVWIFYDKEEGPHDDNGLEPVLQSGVLPDLDLAFVLEPTDGDVQMGCMGTLHATVTVAGKRAHSARPWQGVNAIYEASDVLKRLANVERKEVRFGDLSFYEVMVATQVWTANSANVVPDRMMVNVNCRFAPGRSAADTVADLRSAVGSMPEIDVTDAAPSGGVYLDHPLVEPWRLRRGLSRAPKQAWTDVARFTERGIPAVNFGPGETAQAHQAGEWCSIDSLLSTYEHLWDFLIDPPGRPRT